MPSSVTLTPRPACLEDLSLTTNPSGEITSQYVAGVGTVDLHKIAAVLYTAFGQYANDAAAGVGGVPIGCLYFSTSLSLLKVRLS